MTAIVIQRPLRGSRISSFYPVKSLPSLSSLDSAFQLQEYISLLIRLDVHDVDTIVSVPGKANSKEKGENESSDLKSEEKEAERERKSEIAVDEACWIYEQLRRLAQDLSHPLITMLQQECTRASCPEMKAGEWLYLCVAHGNDGAMEQCCAIDYILHTLDSATALLNSPRAFPSRLSIPQSSHRHFSSLARRLGRIFAHAYFHHREAFEQAEVESSLYARFLALTSKFELVPAEFLVIPTSSVNGSDGRGRDIEVEPPRLLGASVNHPRDQNEDRTAELGGELGSENWEKMNERGKSPPGLSPGGDQSPRRYGRSRTDTMVFSEAFNVVDELAKGDEHENDGHGDDVVQSEDRTTTEAVPQAPIHSEPEIVSKPEMATPETVTLDVPIIPEASSAHETSSSEAEPTPREPNPAPHNHPSMEIIVDSAESSHFDSPVATDIPELDSPIVATSAESAAVAVEPSASDSLTENTPMHAPEVKEAPSVEPESAPNESPSTPPPSAEPDAQIHTVTDSTPVPEPSVDAVTDIIPNESPAPSLEDKSKEESEDQSASEDMEVEQNVERLSEPTDAPTEAEPAIEEITEPTPAEKEKETEPSS